MRRLTPNDRHIPRDDYNQIAEAAERVLAGDAPPPPLPSSASSVVQVRNDTGADLPAFSVVGLDGLVIGPGKNLALFKAAPLFKAAKPAIEQHSGRIVVTQAPIKKGRIGNAMVEGVTQCKVDVQHANDEFAGPVDERTSSLISGYGNAKILWLDQGSGEQWAVVQLGANNPQRWVPFENGNGQELPAYGLVLLQQPSDTAGGILKSTISGSSYTRLFAANGPVAVPAGGYGLCTLDFPAWLQYSSTGTPDAGDCFGSVAGSSVIKCLDTNSTNHNLTAGGFCLAGPNRTGPTRGLMAYDQRFLTREWIRFTLTEDLTTAMQSASATMWNTWGTVGSMGNGALTVWNIADEENEGSFIFAAQAGATGLAVAQRSASGTIYWIDWVKCPDTCG